MKRAAEAEAPATLDMVSGRSAGPENQWRVRRAFPERTEPTSMLNHETSDHLLSLVAEDLNMSHSAAANKPCNATYFRQSSMARAGSAQAGSAMPGKPGDSTAIRPRLNAITSRKPFTALRTTPLIATP